MRKPLVLSLIRRKSLTSLPFTASYRGFRFEGDAANMIDYHVLSRGGFEAGLSELINIWGRGHGDGVFLDVGANVGIHTLAAAGAYGRVLAIEPFPELVERLGKTVAANSLGNVKVIRTALADETGSVSFRAPMASNLGTGRITDGDAGDGEGLIEVPLARGDDVMEAEGMPLRCVKIDTEGAEKRVLAGLAATLGKDRPLIIFELLERGAGESEVLRGLIPAGYSFYLLEDIKSRRFRLAPWKSGHGDIVAVPEEKSAIVEGFIK